MWFKRGAAGTISIDTLFFFFVPSLSLPSVSLSLSSRRQLPTFRISMPGYILRYSVSRGDTSTSRPFTAPPPHTQTDRRSIVSFWRCYDTYQRERPKREESKTSGSNSGQHNDNRVAFNLEIKNLAFLCTYTILRPPRKKSQKGTFILLRER